MKIDPKPWGCIDIFKLLSHMIGSNLHSRVETSTKSAFQARYLTMKSLDKWWLRWHLAFSNHEIFGLHLVCICNLLCIENMVEKIGRKEIKNKDLH
jgi:hypothetical protein